MLTLKTRDRDHEARTYCAERKQKKFSIKKTQRHEIEKEIILKKSTKTNMTQSRLTW
jgi:hypothetical protein